jgi:hypothetical protein
MYKYKYGNTDRYNATRSGTKLDPKSAFVLSVPFRGP